MAEVGINLSAVNYWGAEYPFLDRMKSAGGWTAVSSTGSSKLNSVNGDGYPTAMPDGASYIYTMIAVDPVKLAMTDRYVLTYSGTADIVPVNAKIISSEPGRMVIEATKDTVLLKVSGLNAKSPLDALSVVREDQVSLFKQGEIFNPDFVSKIDPFSTLRFMDWTNTNGSTIQTWSDRPTVTDRSWAGSEGGVPIEIMVGLANKTHNDMWINIPTSADDGYVRKTLQYVKDHLDSGLKVKVEYSNEVWNFSFDQAKYALAQGDKLFGVDANGDGKVDPDDAKEHVADGYLQFYGYRAAQIASIANKVFGDQTEARLENVLATNATSNIKAILKGVTKADVGSVSTLFDDYATASYFASFGAGTSADIAKLLEWARSGSAGIDAAINEIAHGGALSKTMSVEDSAARLKNHGDTAASLGLDFVIYEGGPAMTATRAAAADQEELIAFYGRVLADPRMGTLYKEVMAGFQAAGGVEFNAFNDAGNSNSKYGVWGALDNIYQSGSVRYDALVELAEQGSSTPARAAISTSLASYALTASQSNMTYVGTGFTTLTGNALANRLAAGNQGSVLFGLGGSDTLLGGAGADYLDGGAGADTMTGGGGNDVYIVDDAGDKVVETAGGGTDEVRTSLSRYTLGNYLENLTFTGTVDFVGRGNDLNNTITGGSGNDTLNGGLGNDILYGGDGDDNFSDAGGADKMVGGRGDDAYNVDDAGDTIIELPGEGYDTVYASSSFSLAGQSLESLRAKGTSAIDLTGNELDNWVVGNDAVNVIRGGAGDDTLKGMGGADTLYGDAGNDLIDGGIGNDTLYGGHGDDRLLGDAGNDFLDGGGGQDVLYGGDGDDRLFGGDGNDVLVGGAGIDQLTGGAGNDRFLFQAISDIGKTRGGSDIILDFATGDKIDLSAVDAIRNTVINDAFTFIGSATFTKHAGELRVASYGDKWEISGDIDGDGIADFVLGAYKAAAFVAADFIL